MQRWGGCRDAERLQACSCYSCGDGVIAEVGWLQECRVVALMQGGCRDVVIAEMGVVAGMQGGCIDARWLQA